MSESGSLSADQKEKIMQSRVAEKSAHGMIQLTAIVDGKPCTMLTGERLDEAHKSCIDRFGKSRFKGFAPIPVETVARSKWAEYQAKKITRAELEAWLKGREDEKAIRKLFNQMRG